MFFSLSEKYLLVLYLVRLFCCFFQIYLFLYDMCFWLHIDVPLIWWFLYSFKIFSSICWWRRLPTLNIGAMPWDFSVCEYKTVWIVVISFSHLKLVRIHYFLIHWKNNNRYPVLSCLFDDRPSILVSDILGQYDQEPQSPTTPHQLLRRTEASPGNSCFLVNMMQASESEVVRELTTIILSLMLLDGLIMWWSLLKFIELYF